MLAALLTNLGGLPDTHDLHPRDFEHLLKPYLREQERLSEEQYQKRLKTGKLRESWKDVLKSMLSVASEQAETRSEAEEIERSQIPK